MKTIHNFPLVITDRQTISIDWDAKFLSVGIRNGQLCLWAMVNTENGYGRKNIRIIGTGHAIDNADYLTYIGTVIDGFFVWHVFEEII